MRQGAYGVQYRDNESALAQSEARSTAAAAGKMRCISCREEYGTSDAGTCKECYEEASETEEELKREIDDLKAKIAFLGFRSPSDHHHKSISVPPFADVVLIASDHLDPAPVHAHKAILVWP